MGNAISVAADASGHTKKAEQVTALSTDTLVGRSANMKIFQDDLLIWLDSSINDNNQDYRNTITYLQRTVNTLGTFSTGDECIQFIKTISNDKVNMIVSGSLGRRIVPQIHDIPQINSIFIFCGDKERHKQWAETWPKVQGVFSRVLPMCKAIKQTAKQCEENAISIKFMPTSTNIPSKKLDKLHYSFMYTQILKEILLSIKFEQQHIYEFIAYCRQMFVDNDYELNNITKLEQEYFDRTPIWWYTFECFLYRMLNRGLRTMDVDIIIKMGFFIDHLHRHIEKLHSQQFDGHDSNKTFIVYRGQSMSKIDFDQIEATKGGLMSFNSFLSTSKDRNISLNFAHRGLIDPDMVGVIFVMTIDPSKSTTPFASITDVSYFKNKEDEVLFSMHTVFRTHDVKPIDESDRLFQVELTLTSDNDQDLRSLTDCIVEETKGSTGWDRLASLLLKLGQPKKAQEVHEIMLEHTTNESEKERLYSLPTSDKPYNRRDPSIQQ